MSEREKLLKWLRQFFCSHRHVTNNVIVSGYGYTEYTVCFCLRCEKGLIRQTKGQQ